MIENSEKNAISAITITDSNESKVICHESGTIKSFSTVSELSKFLKDNREAELLMSMSDTNNLILKIPIMHSISTTNLEAIAARMIKIANECGWRFITYFVNEKNWSLVFPDGHVITGYNEIIDKLFKPEPKPRGR